MTDELREAREMIEKIAAVATGVGWQAGVSATEIAGLDVPPLSDAQLTALREAMRT